MVGDGNGCEAVGDGRRGDHLSQRRVVSVVLIFDRLVLDVANLEHSVRFYTETLDFQVVNASPWAGHRTSLLQLGAFHLLLLEQPDEGHTRYQLPKAGPVIGLSEVRIEARAEALQRANADVVQPLTQSPWGGRSLLMRDPDGYLIMIQEPREERDAPPQVIADSPPPQ
jgi:catechol 2,3-dioxygenase-like lactoylglutathione lyase family enzyme